MDQQEHGELLYDYTAQLGAPTEYGVSMADIISGKAAAPASGVRLDLPFEGEATGKLAGRVRGVDYLNIRADGRMELDIRASVLTTEGERIALQADGVCIPQQGSPVSLLRENVTLRTASPNYAWVNTLQVWAIGEVNMETGELHLRGYLPR